MLESGENNSPGTVMARVSGLLESKVGPINFEIKI